MISRFRTWENLYRDSVALMQLSSTLSALPGVENAYAIMCTSNNVELLQDAGVDVEQIPDRPNDLVVVVVGAAEQEVDAALEQADAELHSREASQAQEATQKLAPRSIGMGLEEMPPTSPSASRLALISTPGEYAAAEAIKALNAGLHVMLFSDNVTLEDEIRIKQMAHERRLLVMGPDCGTAIVNGIPLGFANVVRRGNIGLIGASGTGLQQITSLIDQWGGGISQAIGTGSHDLHAQVGGITMLDALDALSADPNTEVLVLVSKPPAPDVARRVLERAQSAGKPVVVDFIGAELERTAGAQGRAPVGQAGAGTIHVARTLEEAAAQAIRLANGASMQQPESAPLADRQFEFAAEQQYLRGLFSGGTFSYESTLILHQQLGPIYSNTPADPKYVLDDPWTSREHTTVDLGDDEFTRGRPHPMIDYRLRIERILQEARDPKVAVILLDVVLGYGSHPNPAEELVPAIVQAQERARAAGRDLAFIASVCGTERDPQQLSRQETALRQAGVLLAPSNAAAARLASRVLCKRVFMPACTPPGMGTRP